MGRNGADEKTMRTPFILELAGTAASDNKNDVAATSYTRQKPPLVH